MRIVNGIVIRDWSNDILTPPWILVLVRQCLGRIDLDPCGHVEDRVKARKRILWPEQDGLEIDWRGGVYVNPPFGDGIKRWYHKAWISAGHGARVLLLVPVWTDSKAWQFYVPRADAICFFRGRLNFLYPGNKGEGRAGASNSHAIIGFGIDPQYFIRVFDGFGWIVLPRLQTEKVRRLMK